MTLQCSRGSKSQAAMHAMLPGPSPDCHDHLRTRLLGQPQSYILRQLEDAEKRVRECELKLGQAQVRREGRELAFQARDTNSGRNHSPNDPLQTAERQLRQELEHCKADVDEKENKCKCVMPLALAPCTPLRCPQGAELACL